MLEILKDLVGYRILNIYVTQNPSFKNSKWLGMVAHTYNPVCQETGPRGSPQVQGLSSVHSKLGTSPVCKVCVVRPCLHTNKIKRDSEWNGQNGPLRKEEADLIHLPKHIQNAVSAKIVLEMILSYW